MTREMHRDLCLHVLIPVFVRQPDFSLRASLRLRPVQRPSPCRLSPMTTRPSNRLSMKVCLESIANALQCTKIRQPASRESGRLCSSMNMFEEKQALFDEDIFLLIDSHKNMI